MKILITGSNGYIAKSIKKYFNEKYKITTLNRQDCDLCDESAVQSWFKNKFFDIVIHTAISGGSRLTVDTKTVLEQNLKMFFNIYNERHCYTKFINFGSGAEIFSPTTPYGESKLQILESIKQTDNFYSLRIFGVFDENELETRFIKGNIIRYLKKQPMIIHSNKIMDFYYMGDLIQLVEYYIENNSLTKTINCSYSEKHTLSNLANIINTLDNYQVPVTIIDNKEMEFYCGNPHEVPIKEIGLRAGIINTFNHLKGLQNDSSEYFK